jgi:predicted ATPase
MLVILLSRPELTLPWTDQAHISALTLNRLDRVQVASMIASLIEEGALAQAIQDQIVTKTDGVPLFVEEMTKAVLESAQRTAIERGADVPITLAVPDTLHDSLMARLDQLAPMKIVAQMAAVIGREFSIEVLQTIAPLKKRDVQAAIDRLLSLGLVYRSDHPAGENYIFKHALVQDEAYASLLRVERRALHRKIAEVLVSDLATASDVAAEIVAHHYTQADEPRTAIDYWLKAAQQASERSAFIEASSHLKAALDLLTTLPATRERDALELRLQHSRGSTLAAGRGFGADETSRTFKRALELCDRFEHSAQVFSVLNGLIGVHVARGEFEQSRDLAEELLARARQQDDLTARLMGHRALGMSLFLIGELRPARVHLLNSLELYDETRHGPLALIFSQDFKVSAQAYLGLASVLFGDINSALENGRDAVAHADHLRHPHSICYALAFLAGAHLLCRDPEPVLPLIERSMRLADEYGFALWTAAGQMLGGWARLEFGDAVLALTEIRHSLESLEATGALIWVQFARYLLAAALLRAGRYEDAVEVVDQELTKLVDTSGRWYEAELHRIKGNLLLARGAPDTAAEACYEKAIAVATRQGARLWQLRAENDLTRLRLARGRSAEARARLAPLHASFGEETAHRDVAEARMLLDEIASS